MNKISTKRRLSAVGAVPVIGLAVICLLIVHAEQWWMGIIMGVVQQVRKLDDASTTAAGGWLEETTGAAAAATTTAATTTTTKAEAAAGISTRLRFNWADLALSSPMAQHWHSHQRNCGLRRVDFQFRNVNGLGHELHMWTQALCIAAQEGVRIRTALPWSYRDAEVCDSTTSTSTPGSGSNESHVSAPSALECYFPTAEPDCPNDYGSGSMARTGRVLDSSDRVQFYRGNKKSVEREKCRKLMKKFTLSFADVRASAIEYLFASISQVVIDEAHRQLNILFGAVDSAVNSFSRLITVHIRWGDKKEETALVSVDEYVRAVQTLLAESPADQPGGEGKVGIYLSTEDPLALELFQKEADNHGWTVFVDVYLQEFSLVRDGSYNGNPHMAKTFQGRPGLVALASLLVAMQADDFVLTTTSNWSRLMNELRKNVLDPRCNQCTRMIDLSPGEW